MFIQRVTLTIVILSLLAVVGCKKSEPVTQEQVKEDVKQAVETTGEYLGQKKDDAIAQVKETYSTAEGQIQTFLSDLKTSKRRKMASSKTGH